MDTLKYRNHYRVHALVPFNYYAAAQIILFLQHGGLKSDFDPKSTGVETWLEEDNQLGWSIDTGAKRRTWNLLDGWQKYQLPKFMDEESVEFCKNHASLYRFRVWGALEEARIFYGIEQYARNQLLYLEHPGDRDITLKVAQKLALPSHLFRVVFDFEYDSSTLDYTELHTYLAKAFSERTDYRLYAYWAPSLEHWTARPHQNLLNNAVIGDYYFLEIPAKQIRLTVCPKAKRWCQKSKYQFIDTYRFDSQSKTLSRKKGNTALSLEGLQITVSSHDHLFGSERRVENFAKTTRELLDYVTR